MKLLESIFLCLFFLCGIERERERGGRRGGVLYNIMKLVDYILRSLLRRIIGEGLVSS